MPSVGTWAPVRRQLRRSARRRRRRSLSCWRWRAGLVTAHQQWQRLPAYRECQRLLFHSRGRLTKLSTIMRIASSRSDIRPSPSCMIFVLCPDPGQSFLSRDLGALPWSKVEGDPVPPDPPPRAGRQHLNQRRLRAAPLFLTSTIVTSQVPPVRLWRHRPARERLG